MKAFAVPVSDLLALCVWQDSNQRFRLKFDGKRYTVLRLGIGPDLVVVYLREIKE